MDKSQCAILIFFQTWQLKTTHLPNETNLFDKNCHIDLCSELTSILAIQEQPTNRSQLNKSDRPQVNIWDTWQTLKYLNINDSFHLKDLQISKYKRESNTRMSIQFCCLILVNCDLFSFLNIEKVKIYNENTIADGNVLCKRIHRRMGHGLPIFFTLTYSPTQMQLISRNTRIIHRIHVLFMMYDVWRLTSFTFFLIFCRVHVHVYILKVCIITDFDFYQTDKLYIFSAKIRPGAYRFPVYFYPCSQISTSSSQFKIKKKNDTSEE
jgi:hypothetical protein